MVVLHIVDCDLVLIARGKMPDLVAVERNAAVESAVRVGVPARARQQMQAAATVEAILFSFPYFGVDAALFASVTGPNQPDTAEVSVEKPDNGIGDVLEFLAQRCRREQRLLQQANTFQPQESGLAIRLRLLFQGNIPDRCLKNRLSAAIDPGHKDGSGEFRAVYPRACPLEETVAFPEGRTDDLPDQFGGIAAVRLPCGRVFPRGPQQEIRFISGAEHCDSGRIGGGEPPQTRLKGHEGVA